MTERSFTFWHRWLLGATILFIIVGIFIAVWPDSPIFAAHTGTLAERYFGKDTLPAEAARMRQFLFAPLGATIAGYFLVQLFVVAGPFRRRERWAWHAVLWPLLLWFTLDSALSIMHGMFANVWMVNVWTLLLVGAPLAATRRW